MTRFNINLKKAWEIDIGFGPTAVAQLEEQAITSLLFNLGWMGIRSQQISKMRFSANPLNIPCCVVGSVTRLDDFWNSFGTNFLTKDVQMFGYFLLSCENHHFLSQTGEATFWATFVKNLGYFLFQHLVVGIIENWSMTRNYLWRKVDFL